MEKIKWNKKANGYISQEWTLDNYYIQFEITIIDHLKKHELWCYKSIGDADVLYFKKLSSAKKVAKLLRNG